MSNFNLPDDLLKRSLKIGEGFKIGYTFKDFEVKTLTVASNGRLYGDAWNKEDEMVTFVAENFQDLKQEFKIAVNDSIRFRKK